MGISGGEAGIRGFVDAYDAKTGKRAWRFYTIPGPGEPGHDSWKTEAWKTGGGSTWVTGSYDPEPNLLYWGVGNPGPDWNGDPRPGDNLYTCSLVALDGDTGKLKWHFQFTPHDTHDWDSAHVPVLFEAEIRGQQRKVVAKANRNAFYYVLDRENGQFLSGQAYSKQTWAKGLDDSGRPMEIPGTQPSEEGTLVWPNLNGATCGSARPTSGAGIVLCRGAARLARLISSARRIQARHVFRRRRRARIPPDDVWGAIRALERPLARWCGSSS